MIVQSFGQLKTLTDAQPTWGAQGSSSLTLYGSAHSYAEIYKRQPNVRTCVDFLARNIAQLGLHIFRRVSDSDRARLADHDLARWLGKPNPARRRYRLTEALMGDLGIYFDAYWMKVRYQEPDNRNAIGLVRLPPEEMEVAGALLPSHFVWTSNGRARDFALSEIVHFSGYNPLNALMGLSPLETLRRILAEEWAAGEHREAFWRNAGRMDGIVTRPKEKPRYTQTQADSWREQWQAQYAGGAQAGKTVLLQDGETYTPTSWSAKDSEYLGARKLTREECAAAYHIPLPLVGILEHATFSNVKEQHKHLYQDTLGPWLEMIQQEIEGQLLIECEDQRDVYVEFNIAEKLKGSFEEQANSLVTLTGKPIMKVNEARGRLNLPRDDDPESDKIAQQQGGPAVTNAPSDRTRPIPPADEDADADANLAPILQAARARQQAKLHKLPMADRASAFFADIDRWNRELAADLTLLLGAEDAARQAQLINAATLAALVAGDV